MAQGECVVTAEVLTSIFYAKERLKVISQQMVGTNKSWMKNLIEIHIREKHQEFMWFDNNLHLWASEFTISKRNNKVITHSQIKYIFIFICMYRTLKLILSLSPYRTLIWVKIKKRFLVLSIYKGLIPILWWTKTLPLLLWQG